jgi:SAM-dependent methyltransferase
MFLRRFASRLPFPVRQMLRAWKYRLQKAAVRFRSDEPEFHQLSELVQVGDWVLDVGANVGQYTLRLSELVGREGRVIAFEPILETFEILASMARRARAIAISRSLTSRYRNARTCFRSACQAVRLGCQTISRRAFPTGAIEWSPALHSTNCPLRGASH